MWRPISATLALLGALALAGDASAARLTGLDPDMGVEFILEGPTLTATITAGPQATKARRELQGRTVTAACSSAYGDVKPVHTTVPWPTGSDQLAFTFGRDVSERASWCLLERGEGGRDIAEVGFGPAPALFFALPDDRPAADRRAVRRYLRLTDADGRTVTTSRGQLLQRRVLRPGRYRLIRFERACTKRCQTLGPPRALCAREFRLKPGAALAALVRVSQRPHRCRIAFRQ